MVGQVFISYSRKDYAAMQRIVKFLRKQGINIWVDHENLVPGTPIWESEIEKAIKNASAIIVILSPDSKNSEWVRREISLADQYGTRIFPVLVHGDEDTSISIRLITRQYVDIRQYEEVGLNLLSTALAFYLQTLETQQQRAREEGTKESSMGVDAEKAVHETPGHVALTDKKPKKEGLTDATVGGESKAKERTSDKDTSQNFAGHKNIEDTGNIPATKEIPKRRFKQHALLKWSIIGIIGFSVVAIGVWGISYLPALIIPTQESMLATKSSAVPASTTTLPSVMPTSSPTRMLTNTPRPPKTPTMPIPTVDVDFSGGSRIFEVIKLSTWPTFNNEYGHARPEDSNYVLETNSNTWIGPGSLIPISNLTGDFIVDIDFKVEQWERGLSLSVDLSDYDTNYSSLAFIYGMSQSYSGDFSIYEYWVENRFYANQINQFAEQATVSAEYTSQVDWTEENKLTIKREGSNMSYYINGYLLQSFNPSLFVIKQIGVGIAGACCEEGRWRIVLTNIVTRVP